MVMVYDRQGCHCSLQKHRACRCQWRQRGRRSHGRDECRPLFFSFEQGEDDISHYTHLLQQVLAVTLKGSGQTAIAEFFKSHDRVRVERQMSSQSLSQQWQCDHATTFTQRTHHPAFRRVPPLLVRGVKWNVMQVQGRLGG